MFFQRSAVIILIVLPLTSIGCVIKAITIFSDFTNDDDLQFFKNTLPWIVDNIGSDIRIRYYFKDSGKTSGPRQCVLSQLSRNTYLQATFLNCEANGNPQSECIKQLPLSNRALETCIKLSVNGYVKAADREFRRYKIKTTPVIAFSKKIILSKGEPEDILKEICLLYPKNKPTGCLQPKPLPTEKSNDETSRTSKIDKEGLLTDQYMTKKYQPSTEQSTVMKVESVTDSLTTKKASPEKTTTNKVEPSTGQTTTTNKVEPSTEQTPTTKKTDLSDEQISTNKEESSSESETNNSENKHESK